MKQNFNKLLIISLLFIFPALLNCGNIKPQPGYEPGISLVDIPQMEISKKNFFEKDYPLIPYNKTNFNKLLEEPGKVLLKITIQNPHNKSEQYLVSKYNFYKITFFQKNNGIISELEDGYFLANTNKTYRLPAFPLALHSGENTYYALIDIRFMLYPEFELMTEKELSEKKADEYLIIGGVLAIFFVMTVYNFILFIFVRKPHYLVYVIYLGTTVLFNLNYLGVGYNFIGSMSSIITDNWIYWLIINGGAAALFSILFLEIKMSSSYIYRLFILILALFTVLLFITLYKPFIALTIYNFLLLFMSIAVIPLGIHRFISGFRPAIYYTLAWGTLALSTIVFNMTVLKVIPWTLVGEWSYYFGASAEIILLSFALGDLMRFKEQKLMKQQAEYINKLEIEKKEKSHVYNQLRKIVYKHQISMIKNGAILEDTMPTMKSNGVVIALDIVNSSRMPHDKAQEFFRDFFYRCQELMLIGYDEEKLLSSAYRIKEMGDGFLCSVGFPFKNPGNEINEESAVILGNSFINSFHDLLISHSIEEKIFCSVAIAEGELEAFYPVAGVKEYDMYGNGIILAARYETLRKHLFKETTKQSSIMMIQGKSFRKLSPDWQKDYQEYNLSDHPIAEDPNENYSYYKRFEKSK